MSLNVFICFSSVPAHSSSGGTVGKTHNTNLDVRAVLRALPTRRSTADSMHAIHFIEIKKKPRPKPGRGADNKRRNYSR
jgi:hypothetical protein